MITSILYIIDKIFFVYYIFILARIIMSWLPVPNNEILRSIWEIIHKITEPYLAIFRKILPPLMMGGGGFDFSPIVAIIVLEVLKRIIFSIIGAVL